LKKTLKSTRPSATYHAAATRGVHIRDTSGCIPGIAALQIRLARFAMIGI